MADYHNIFIEFLKEEFNINPSKIPDINKLYLDCFEDIEDYIKWNHDTVTREALMDSVSISLIGRSCPTYGDNDDIMNQFNELMQSYYND